VQKVLLAIVGGKNSRRGFLAKDSELKLVELLLNPNVTEFDFSPWSPEDAENIYKHLTLACPKVKKVHRPAPWVARNRKRLFAATMADFCWTLNWSNLRVAGFYGFCFSDDLLELMNNRAPKLE